MEYLWGSWYRLPNCPKKRLVCFCKANWKYVSRDVKFLYPNAETAHLKIYSREIPPKTEEDSHTNTLATVLTKNWKKLNCPTLGEYKSITFVAFNYDNHKKSLLTIIYNV